MPRLIITPPAQLLQQDIFVGREQELADFRKSVRYVLGHDVAPDNALYPHIFLPYGEGGMGKSTLLRQFIRIASEEGFAKSRIIFLNLDYQEISSIDSLSQILVKTIRQQHPGFDQRYRNAFTKREALLPRYHDLERQWVRWEAIRESANNDLDQLEKNYQQLLRNTEQQRANFGTAFEPVYLITQSERALDDLAALRAFRNTLGRTPQSFSELIEQELGTNSELFINELQMSQMLVKDLFDLAEADPLILIIDTYEKADQHDDWIRNVLLCESSDRMLTVIAGRNYPNARYHRTFRDMYTKYVRSYNLNSQLQLKDIHAYLIKKLRVNDEQSLSEELVERISSLSQGIPFALEVLGDQLAEVGNLGAYSDIHFNALDQRAVVKAVTDCFLHYALDYIHDSGSIRAQKLRDRQRIKALALLMRPDATLLSNLWGMSLEEGQRAARELNDSYSFIFADHSGYNMHSLVREFVRAHIRENRRSDFEWQALKEDMRRILPIIQERVNHITQSITNIDELYTSSEWRIAIIDMLNANLWLGNHKEACCLLLNKWLEAQYANSTFCDDLMSLSEEFKHITLYLSQMVDVLQLKNITKELPRHLIQWIEPHAHAVLYYLRAQTIQVENITEESLEKLHNKISFLERGYEYDANWSPICELLTQSYTYLGHYYLYKRVDYTLALQAYDRAIEIHPDDAMVLKNRGVAKHNLHDLTGALADFELALALRPGDASAFLNRGQTKRLRGDLIGALLDFDQALTSRPDDPNVLFIRGRLKNESGDIVGALDDFDQALKLQPDHLDLLYHRGILRRKNGDQKRAIEDFDLALTLRPNDPNILLSRGFAKAEQKNIVEALKDLDRVLEIRPDDLNTTYNRGVFRHLKGDLQGALEDFENVCQNAPDKPKPFYQAARIYSKQRQTDLAIDRLARAMKLDNNYRIAVRNNPEFGHLAHESRYTRLLSET